MGTGGIEMDKRMINISRDVRNGRFLEENIPMLFNYMADQYHAYASVRLAMHYETLYEAYLDDADLWSEEAREVITQLNKIIKKHVLTKHKVNEMEKTIHFVDELRKNIMLRMKILTNYTDIFQIYEYILNRVEYRFKEEDPAKEDDEFAKEVLRYIFDTQDNVVINEKIKEIIGQLPIRMTKQKYFDRLRESIELYQGADRTSLDSYLYILRTSAMLSNDEKMKNYYPELWEQKERLSSLKYKEITKTEFDEAEAALRKATLFLESEATVYYSFQEIVNEVYAILLCDPYAGMSPYTAGNQQELVSTILMEINSSFLKNVKSELSQELYDKFTGIEGVQEELSSDLVGLEDALYEIDQNYRKLTESIMVNNLLNILLRTRDLLSNSLFIDWEEEKNEETVDEKLAEAEAKSLEEEMSELFAGQDKAVSRAVMANTLNKMPVFFKNHTEVMDYVRYSLEHCNDSYEKTACMEIINNIMSE
jgi:hypothetical protein